MKKLIIYTAAVFLSISATAEEILVLAAASTTDVMKDCAAAYTKQSGNSIKFNFASSGALARQISSGAPADVYISANIKWMDFLEQKKLIEKSTRREIFGNRIALITHKSNQVKAVKPEEINLPQLIKGRIAVGGMKSVPCGMYAKEIFDNYGWFDELKKRLVAGENVRQVLFFVERNEVDAGIVYLTDAKISDKVKVVTVFPEEKHSPIRYPAALCSSSGKKRTAGSFLNFLSGTEAVKIFSKYGFVSNR